MNARPQLWLTALLLAACAPAGSDGTTADCAATGDAKCDKVGPNTALGMQLAGRADPIATWLRHNVDAPNETVACESGQCTVATGDFGKIWSDINQTQGCAPTGQRSYVVSDDVLTAGKPFPRVIGVACDDDVAGKAADLFISAPFANSAGNDVDGAHLEMFAWDAPGQVYRFYATSPVDGGKMSVEVEPTRCQGCHLGPADLTNARTHMMPIMNELTLPWPHWNSAPDFPSRDFIVPPAVQTAPVYSSLTSAAHLASAARFQDVIRRGAIDRVTRARALDRSLPANVDVAMGLLKPLFCDEQVNYVSEDGNTASTAALFDSGALRSIYGILGLNRGWNWLGEPSQLVLPARGSDPNEVFMVPVRGQTGVELEARLVALNVLPALDALRVHALDWKHPVFSEFRCGLWQIANARLSKTDTLGAPTTADLTGKLLREIMKIDGTSLIPNESDVLAIADAQATPPGAGIVSLATQSCANGYCIASADAFGALLETELASYDQNTTARTRIAALRDVRVAHVLQQVKNDAGIMTQRFGAAPSLPGHSR